jgi:hypothetical protein
VWCGRENKVPVVKYYPESIVLRSFHKFEGGKNYPSFPGPAGLLTNSSHVRNYFFKVWWQNATLFVYFCIFYTYIRSFNHIRTICTYIHRRSLRPLSIPHCLYAQWEAPPCGAEQRIELGACLTASRLFMHQRFIQPPSPPPLPPSRTY